MDRFTVVEEKVSGTKVINYAIKDSNTNNIVIRYADKDKAYDLMRKLNDFSKDSEGE